MENETITRRIGAAENLTIEYEPGVYWRVLISDETGTRRKLVEALKGRSLRYGATFASTRRLPGVGKLPLNYVWQVVLGWSRDDEAWHLGLLLARDLADARGSRWCEIARWPDPETNVFERDAEEAGRALAALLDRPFNMIQPRKVRAEEVPLPELPLDIGQWTLEQVSATTLQFKRARGWVFSKWMRIAWYTFLIVVYLVLSITTLNSQLALPNAGTMLPNPELLPYLGLASAALLLVMIVYSIYELLSRPNRIVVDGDQHRIVALRGNKARWERYLDELQSIYVTQVVNRRGARRTIYHGEINLHLGGNTFHQMVQAPQQDEEVDTVVSDNGRAQDAVFPLSQSAVTSDLQAAGVYIAKVLGGLPVWYDQRTR